VMFPYLWEPGYIPRDPQPIFFHDPAKGDARVIDVGMGGAEFPAHRRQHEAEQRGEDLRLAYVALTRAQHQAVVWWAGSWDSRNSALGRLLFSRGPDGTVPAFGRATPSDATAIARFEELAEQVPGCISVERAEVAPQATWSDPRPPAAELAAARFDRALDWGWRRTSYSDITAGAHEARVASEPEERLVTDEDDVVGPPTPPAVVEEGDAALRELPSLLGQMPSGVHVGTFVHRVFEATDFAAPDLAVELGRRMDDVQAQRAVDIGDRAVALAGLEAVIETPLGPLLDGERLRDVPRRDRLDELDFELPLAGGDAPTGRVDLGAIAAVLRDDPGLADYAERLADPALRSRFRGYLTGSVDLVVRRGDRFTVVDYKTNRLGVPGEELSAWDYRPEMLAAEMRRSHYVLQALLYTVVLHRFLRWRLPRYDPERNLAGVLYLFLRGMSGADTPLIGDTPCGVYAWRPPAGLVARLSDVLDGAAP
jgi:exodeoxyribonuclease V beta subunit